MTKTDFSFLQAYEYVTSAMGQELKGLVDSWPVSGSVKNNTRHVAMGDIQQVFNSLPIAGVDRMFNI